MWTFNGVRIYPQDYSGNGKPTIARLQPVEGPTILQFFGYESPTHKMGCVVVGEADIATLSGMIVDSDTLYVLSGSDGTYESYYIANFQWSRRSAIWQSVRQDLDCTTPLFDVEIELYK